MSIIDTYDVHTHMYIHTHHRYIILLLHILHINIYNPIQRIRKIYFKELAHVTVGAAKFENCRASRLAGDPGKLMLQFKSESAWKQTSFFLENLGLLLSGSLPTLWSTI